VDVSPLSNWSVLSPAIIVVGACLIVLCERIRPYDRRHRLFREGFFLDFFWYTLVQSYLLGLVISGFIAWVDRTGGFSRLALVSSWPKWVQLAFFWVTHDLYIYWFHRAQHTVPVLFRTHEAHHSGKDVDWLSGSRSHALEILINQTIEYAPMVLLGAHPDVPLMKGALDAVWGMFIHSNIDVRLGVIQYVFNGPEMHRWHHADDRRIEHKNFATKIAVWDWIFKTAFLPKTEKPANYGLFGNPPFPSGFFQQQAYAFRRFKTPEMGRDARLFLLRAFGTAAAMVALAVVLRSIDWAAAAQTLMAVGPAALIVLCPYAAAMVLDVSVFARLLRHVSHRDVRPLSLLGPRLATEAIANSMPAGAVVGESVQPGLVARASHVSASDAMAAALAKRWCVQQAHALYILGTVILGWSFVAGVSVRLTGHGFLPWLIAASALLPFVASLILEGSLTRANLASRLHGMARRLQRRTSDADMPPSAGETAARRIDSSLSLLGKARGLKWSSTAALMGIWALESVETFLALRLVGIPLGLVEAFAFEGGLSVVRSLAFAAPGGLGVQDLGYATFLGATAGANPGSIGAFLILKRSKELVFIAGGYASLVLTRASKRPEVGGDPVAVEVTR
jgi:sterol desaturase/sphingolipid hydroxylase (fatty acid hydroxylase superfamily)